MLEGSRQGLRAAEIHERLGRSVAERTVFRDLVHLQDAGFPLFEQDGRWRVLTAGEGGFSIPVKPTEALGLLVSQELLEPIRGSQVGAAVAQLGETLAAMLSPAGRSYVEAMKDSMLASFLAPGDYANRSAELASLHRAIAESLRLRVSYWTPGTGESDRDIDPYTLWFAEGRLYLLGWCHKRGGFRTFSVDRLRRVVVTDESFEPDPSFESRAIVGAGFGVWQGEEVRVVVDFSSETAHLARERRFHRSQQLEDRPGGGCRVTMTVAGLPRVAAWVASFGGAVLAREPPELVDMVLGIHRDGLAGHEAPDPG